jgi:hypothetical protein
MQFTRFPLAAIAVGAFLLTGCATTDMQMGSSSAKTMATGSAAGGATDNASSQLERCESPLGTVSLVENQSARGGTPSFDRRIQAAADCQSAASAGAAVQLLHRGRARRGRHERHDARACS